MTKSKLQEKVWEDKLKRDLKKRGISWEEVTEEIMWVDQAIHRLLFRGRPLHPGQEKTRK